MSGADGQYYYFDQTRTRQGPFAETEFLRLISDGSIGPESMVWFAGIPDWRAAGHVEKFAPLFAARPAPPPAPLFAQPAPATPPPPAYAPAPARVVPMTMPSMGAPVGALTSTLPVWEFFGRLLLMVLGMLLVVPAPWTSTGFYRFLAINIVLPGGRRLTFAGQPGDIWLIFVGTAAVGLAGMAVPGGGLLVSPIKWILEILILRWFVSKLGSEDGSLRLSFDGTILGFIGWNALFLVSFITIVGWAWVARAMLQWMCANTKGTETFEFHGTGWEILWRTVVCGLCSMFLIPIPWIMRWYTVWLVGQFKTVRTTG